MHIKKFMNLFYKILSTTAYYQNIHTPLCPNDTNQKKIQTQLQKLESLNNEIKNEIAKFQDITMV